MAIKKKKDSGKFPKIQLNLLAQFQELLQFNIKHDYFQSKEFPVGKIHIQPTDTTKVVLQQNSLQFRVQPSGFLLGVGGTDQYTPLTENTAPVHLSFIIKMHDPKFLNYSEMPFEFDNDQVFYFHNRDFDKETTDYNNLSQNRLVGVNDKIDISPSIFTYEFDEEQYGTEIEIQNVMEETVFSVILDDGVRTCDIALVNQPEGKYTILINGLEEKSIYVYNGMRPPFAILDIFIDKDDFSDYTFYNDDEKLIKKDYNIHFAARAVRWRYVIIENSNQGQHKDHEIYDSVRKEDHLPMPFTLAETIDFDGKEAIAIWTDKKIPFQERPQYRFKLKTKRGKSGVEWIVPLPNASGKIDVKVNPDDRSEVYTELMITL